MTRQPVAWLLNFDADAELARPLGYLPPRALTRHDTALREALVDFVVPGDIVLDHASFAPPAPPPRITDADRYVGRAWCPTPRALKLLARAGVTAAAAPSLEVLQRVNHRAFSSALGPTLDGAAFVFDRAALDARLARGGRWVVKRPFSFAGRGQRRFEGEVDAASEPWLAASLDQDGVQVEPWVERIVDFVVHGAVGEQGDVVVGEPAIQRCTVHGAWTATERAAPGEIHDDERAALHEEVRRVGGALAEAGYWGPYGIDAFRYRRDDGGVALCPRVEINARYTMGWAVGMGALRGAL